MAFDTVDSVARTIASVAPHLTPEQTISRRALGLEGDGEGERSPAEESLPRLSLADGSEPNRSADFELLRVLGEGGVGRVMLARQRSVGREVAVKVARDRARGSAALRVEGRTMGRLEHPNVVPVHAIGVDDDGEVVLVMKHIEGVDWRTLLRDPEHPWWARLDVPAAQRLSFHLDVLAQIANALHYAHGHGVIHRDVKPENVLIGAHGDVYLADWGVASLPDERTPDAPHVVVGTPAYMAPEMVLGNPMEIDARTDVFLLGASLHEILVGKPRHPGRSTPQVLISAFACEPYDYPVTVPDELAALARAATARERSERPESALAFRRALDTWRVHHGAIVAARRARQVLAEARALHDARGREALDEVDRLLLEARFGFTQALREWPEHEAAREGLREALILATQIEIARGSVQGARGELARLDDPPPELVASVEAMEARLAAEKAERDRLVAMKRDLDLSVASSERRVFVGTVLVVGLALMAFAIARRMWTGTFTVGHPELVVFTAFALLPASALALAMRRRKTQNTAGGAFVTGVLVTIAGSLVNRVVAMQVGTPISAMLTIDCVLYVVSMVSLRPIVPRIVWLVPWVMLGGVGTMVLPAKAPLVFGTVLLTSLIAVYARWSWFMQRAPGDEAGDARR